MNKWKITTLASLFLLAVISSIRAEVLGPGTYRGYYAITRWGQKVFHLGPFHLFVSDDAAKTLEHYRSKPLEIAVSKLSQPISPGGGLIAEVAAVNEKGLARGLTLSARLKSKEVLVGQGVSLHLSFRNRSKESIKVWPNSLAIDLVTTSPFPNESIGYKDPEGYAYWCYQDSNPSRAQGNVPRTIACREIHLPWTVSECVSHGKGIHEDTYEGMVIEPNGRFEGDYTAGKELLAGEYEVFFYLSSGNLSSQPGPMTQRLPFDVVTSKGNIALICGASPFYLIAVISATAIVTFVIILAVRRRLKVADQPTDHPSTEDVKQGASVGKENSVPCGESPCERKSNR